MISKAMEKALNEQLNYELYSAYTYVAMAAYFEDQNLGGFAAWLKIQAQEETTHAMKFYGYIVQAKGRVTLDAIDKPKGTWPSALAAFQSVYDHELKVTKRIHKLVDLARKESDYATEAFLQWFVTEQIQEEADPDAIVQKLKLIGDNPQGLFMMDTQLGARRPEAAGGAA